MSLFLSKLYFLDVEVTLLDDIAAEAALGKGVYGCVSCIDIRALKENGCARRIQGFDL